MSTLNTEETIILDNMPDHRYVSQNFENAFINGGLKEFRMFIIAHNKQASYEHEKLAVLLRGNNNKIIIYKNNHKIWEILPNGSMWKVSFDFDHARYSRDWDQCLKNLQNLGFKLGNHNTNTEMLPSDKRILITRNKKGNVIGGSIGTISCTKSDFNKKFVVDSFRIIDKIVSDYFKAQPVDYFRKKVSADSKPEYKAVINIKGKESSIYVEKCWQQRLLFHFKDTKNGHYAYDLEFCQRYPDKNFVKQYAKQHNNKYSSVNADVIKQKLSTNEPDMLAIRYENSVPQALVLIEVKSTKSACTGKSGIKKHMEGMKAYSEQAIFMKNRRLDAKKILLQYKKFGFIKSNITIQDIPDNLCVERVVLFTNANCKNSQPVKQAGSALDYYKFNKEDIDTLAKQCGCKIWTTDSNYWDNNINILEVL